MRVAFDPFRWLLIAMAGMLNQQQREVIDYLQEENRVLRQQLGNKRLRLNDEQRRRLAAKAKKLGRRIPVRGCHDRRSGDTPGLALKANLPEIRWQQAA